MNSLIGKYFKHYKGKHYYVLNVSTHTESNEKLVNYINLYDKVNFWSRPLTMWNELVNDKRRFIEIIPSNEDIMIATNYIINKNKT